MSLRKVFSSVTRFAEPSMLCQTLVNDAFKVTFARGYAKVVDSLKYLPSHEWAKVDGDVVTVGITDFAQAELGDVVYVEVPQVGSAVEQKKTFGVVESVKAASDVYSPVSGEVVEVNGALADEPAKVNQDAFGAGWLMKVKIADKKQLDALLDSKKYAKHIEDGGH